MPLFFECNVFNSPKIPVRLHTFSETHGPLVWRDTQGPIAPATFSSLEVWFETQRNCLDAEKTRNSSVSKILKPLKT